jgi:uncharacterized protein (DUF58 family)
MPPDLIDALEVRLQRRVSGALPGEHRSPGVGAGVELSQLRAYQPGDDVRQLDPAAFARTRVPHVRVQVPERALTTWIVLDVSPSMAFGTADRLKSDVAEGVATVVGRLATRRSNRVGVLTTGSAREHVLAPHGGRGALLSLRRLLAEGVAPDGRPGPGLKLAFARLGRLSRGSGLIVVVSDFHGPPDWGKDLRALAHRHDILACEVRDPREDALPDVGHLWLVDPETGAERHVDTARSRVRGAYAAAAAEGSARVAAELRHARAQHVVVSTQGDWLRSFGEALR